MSSACKALFVRSRRFESPDEQLHAWSFARLKLNRGPRAAPGVYPMLWDRRWIGAKAAARLIPALSCTKYGLIVRAFRTFSQRDLMTPTRRTARSPQATM